MLYISLIFSLFIATSISQKVKDCPPIEQIENGDTQCSDGSKFGSLCEYSCDEGHVLNDECLRYNSCIDTGFKEGMWKLIAPECQLKPVWSEWTVGSCSSTCGKGVRVDRRNCLQGLCEGDTQRIMDCFSYECEKDCAAIKQENFGSTSGVHTIRPDFQESGVSVSCDMETAGGGWIVMLKRFDGSQDFMKNWQEYEDGFGSLQSEFWLGLQLAHNLTKEGSFELRFDMSDFSDVEAFMTYTGFSIESSEEKYKLNFDDGSGNGTAGDSLSSNRGMKFSTYEQDNDLRDVNCSVKFGGSGGNWYNACTSQTITGLYNQQYYNGNSLQQMKWFKFRQHDAIKTMKMMFRRQN